MIRKHKTIATLLFVILSFFAAIKTSMADEYIPDNWWFKQGYTIDEFALPENIYFINARYEETALGSLVFRNDGDTLIYILNTSSPIPAAEFQAGTRLEPDFIIENSVELPGHRTTTLQADLIIDADRFNRNGRGEITQEPPPPYPTHMVLFVDRVVHIVTVTYSINPDYDPDIDPPPPTLADRTNAADAVVEGTLMVPADHTISDDYIYQGIAKMSVRGWYKGEGPAQIWVNFGMYSGEYTNPHAGENVILFLEAPRDNDESVQLVSDNAYRHVAWTYPYKNHTDEIIAAVGHDPVWPPMLDLVATTIENTAVWIRNGRVIGVGIVATVVVTAVTLLIIQWRNRRLAARS